MKEALTSFDLRVLSREISELKGAYLSQVYQKDSSFILKFNLPGAGKRELYVEPGRWLFLGGDFEKPQEPPRLAQALRGVLTNGRLKEARQVGFDRILSLEFVKERQYTIILEMFAKGNLVLLDEGRILQVLHPGKWRARSLRPGEEYRLPPAGVDPTALDVQGFTEKLRRYEGSVVRVLASQMGLGGLYAEEVCLRGGVQKEVETGDLTEDMLARLYGSLAELAGAVENPRPVMILDPDPVDVLPFPLQIYQGKEFQEFSTMSEAVQALVEAVARTQAPQSVDMGRVQRRIARQEEVLQDLQAEARWTGAAAEHMYTHYQEIESLIQAARGGELREGVDRARKTLRLPIDGQEVEIDFREDLEANARRLYERRKAAIEGLAKVQEAIAESRKELERLAKTEALATGKRDEAFRPSRKFWFDAYRWSLTSGGFLVLAGRDARNNEKLVKKHLEPGDRYLHADLPGSPSVVLKEGGKATEQDLEEACVLAIAFSKAWRVGLGSGSAYWVNPEQVSKTAQSGEYLKTGSFVIRGRRNYLHNLPLRLGVGRVSYQGEDRLIPADPEAIGRLSSHHVTLEPSGPTSRKEIVRGLSAAFRFPADEVERVLPAGSFSVLEARGIRLEMGNSKASNRKRS